MSAQAQPQRRSKPVVLRLGLDIGDFHEVQINMSYQTNEESFAKAVLEGISSFPWDSIMGILKSGKLPAQPFSTDVEMGVAAQKEKSISDLKAKIDELIAQVAAMAPEKKGVP